MLFLACNQTDIHFIPPNNGGPHAQIEVDPEFLDFGGLQWGEQQSHVVQLRNVGDEVLAISPLSTTGSSWFSVQEGAEGALVEPGESLPVVVQYTAGLEPETEAALLVRSSDPSRALIQVPLWGESLIPQLEVAPLDVEFGLLSPGEWSSRPLHLRNVGEGTLEIDPLGIPLLPFLVEQNSGWTLAPGEEREVTLSVSAEEAAIYQSSLQVQSNDPAGWVEVDLHTVIADRPIAVCSADPLEFAPAIGQTVLDGTASYDPTGRSITRYDWSLVEQPQGSTARLRTPHAASFSFSGDLVGSYVAQLVVYSSSGIPSEPCEVEVEAVPGGDLWVEMYWALPNDDMDLHVLAPGGSLTTAGDCYFGNCRTGLDWGVPGDGVDNPYLDIDDIPGTGPENINIAVPAAGVYTVVVHDYPGTINNNSNNVTVKIYVGGVLAWTDTHAITTENVYTDFATVSMPDGTVTPL